MLESRFICGSKILWIEIQSELEKIRNYNKKEVVLKLLTIYRRRTEENPVNMEPNLKENEAG